MSGRDFERIVTQVYTPFLVELGFSVVALHHSGRSYSVRFASGTHRISLSYEPGDEWANLVVSDTPNPSLAEFDDRTRSPRLSDLNRKYMSQVTEDDRRSNNLYFGAETSGSPQETQLFKWARELRLLLRLHLSSPTRTAAQQIGQGGLPGSSSR